MLLAALDLGVNRFRSWRCASRDPRQQLEAGRAPLIVFQQPVAAVQRHV